MLKTYNELSDDLKEEARRKHPTDYNDWSYKVQCVEISFSAK